MDRKTPGIQARDSHQLSSVLISLVQAGDLILDYLLDTLSVLKIANASNDTQMCLWNLPRCSVAQWMVAF